MSLQTAQKAATAVPAPAQGKILSGFLRSVVSDLIRNPMENPLLYSLIKDPESGTFLRISFIGTEGYTHKVELTPAQLRTLHDANVLRPAEHHNLAPFLFVLERGENPCSFDYTIGKNARGQHIATLRYTHADQEAALLSMDGDQLAKTIGLTDREGWDYKTLTMALHYVRNAHAVNTFAPAR